ncbi:MAG: OmpH family outer membrane protein [Kordiimonadaceae bacterium]|nr:OmpH family outer membrane protein [Kordiimonadaceae bacterium]MBT6035188.1 OmpH family outer membrane protein [Kordiimonadaceae bacterium]MBT6330232.1 OmpH family outer membrane protein [Kordiimonadaceae bacterium]
MNKTITFIAALTFASVLFVNSIATAQEIPAARIAIVDNRLIGQNAAVAIDINRQINQLSTELQAEITTTGNALAEEEQTLKAQSAIMPQEAYNQRAEEFQRKAVEYQQDVNQKRRQLELAIANAQAEVDRALKPIRQKVLQDTGATMLMDKTLVLEQVPGLDVTTRIIEQLDISLPSIIVELPPVAETNAAPVAN